MLWLLSLTKKDRSKWEGLPTFGDEQGILWSHATVILAFWLLLWAVYQNNHFSPTGSLSADTAVKIATLLEELSPASLDELAKSLKFDDNTSKSIIRRYTGWKRILVMVLEWENKYVHREGDTVFELKNKLARLHNYCDTKEKRMIDEALKLLMWPIYCCWYLRNRIKEWARIYNFHSYQIYNCVTYTIY